MRSSTKIDERSFRGDNSLKFQTKNKQQTQLRRMLQRKVDSKVFGGSQSMFMTQLFSTINFIPSSRVCLHIQEAFSCLPIQIYVESRKFLRPPLRVGARATMKTRNLLLLKHFRLPLSCFLFRLPLSAFIRLVLCQFISTVSLHSDNKKVISFNSCVSLSRLEVFVSKFFTFRSKLLIMKSASGHGALWIEVLS